MTATRIFRNGKIFTSDLLNKEADAMVVSGGRISWIGKEKDMPPFKGEKVDLNGSRVLPGFIDAHLHPLLLAETSNQVACTPPNVTSISGFRSLT